MFDIYDFYFPEYYDHPNWYQRLLISQIVKKGFEDFRKAVSAEARRRGV